MIEICKKCGRHIDTEFDDCRKINDDTQNPYYLCWGCFEDMWDKNEITKCEGCGAWHDTDSLHRECENSEFTPCPSCGCDVVEGLSREEFMEEEGFRTKFSVIVQFGNGHKRGYTISAKTVKEMMEKLMAHVDLDYDCTISYAAILLDEDVIL